MARYPFTKVAADQNGNVLLSATITVYLEGTTTLATVYAASTGAAATGSQVTTSSTNGSFVFWVDTADYAVTQRFKIAISKTGFNTQSYDNIQVFPASNNNLIDYSVTATGTAADTAETTLATLTLATGYLSAEGSCVKIIAWGATAANTNNKTIKLKFGSTTICSTGAVAWNGLKWRAEALVVRVTSSTQIASAKIFTVGSTAMDNTSPTEDLTASVNILVTGQNGTASANDITFTGATVEAIS